MAAAVRIRRAPCALLQGPRVLHEEDAGFLDWSVLFREDFVIILVDAERRANHHDYYILIC